MPRITTTRELRPDQTIGVDNWFQLEMHSAGEIYSTYRVRIGRTTFWIRQYSAGQTDVLQADVGVDEPGGHDSTTWPVGLEQLNSPRPMKKTSAAKAKKKRKPRRSR